MSRSRSRAKKITDLPKDFIKFVRINAQSPVMFGRPIKARKVLQIGDLSYSKPLALFAEKNLTKFITSPYS